MKLNNTNEEMFDGIFRENLGNTPSPVPPGAWEGISASIGTTTGTAIAGAAVKTALWMKAAIAITIATVGAVAVYQLIPEKDAITSDKQTVKENQIPNPGPGIEQPVNTGDEELSKTPVQVDAAPKAAEPRPAKTLKSDNDQSGEVEMNKDKTYHFWGNINHFKLPEAEPVQPEKQESPLNTDSENGIAKESEQQDPALQEKAESNAIPAFVNGSIVVPNAFTPNNDGVNDTFQIRIQGEESIEFTIFNNYDGSILFTSKNKYSGWDGRKPNGDLAAEGQYFVRVVYTMKGKARETETIRIHLFR